MSRGEEVTQALRGMRNAMSTSMDLEAGWAGVWKAETVSGPRGQAVIKPILPIGALLTPGPRR